MKKFSLVIPVYKQASTIKRDIEDVISVNIAVSWAFL